MAEIKVTPSELRKKAEMLRQYNAKFRSEVQNMVGYESQLATMWEGEAQKAFRKAFNDDKAKMERFASNIDLYIQALETDAQKYEEAEQKATSIATERK
ncbi:MAG: WXG100 family type VII secretion target [Oscillospiraceae bacterium]|nr:WXG100 family type VII secretion target [Oscillospiraceae bacterium]